MAATKAKSAKRASTRKAPTSGVTNPTKVARDLVKRIDREGRHWWNPNALKSSDAAKAVLGGTAELQAAVLIEAAERFGALRDRVKANSDLEMELYNLHSLTGYSIGLVRLISELLKRTALPVDDQALARVLAAFARYEHASLLASPFLAPLATFCEKFAARHGGVMPQNTRASLRAIARSLFPTEGAAEVRLGRRFEKLAAA